MPAKKKTNNMNDVSNKNGQDQRTAADQKLLDCLGKFNNVIVLGITKDGIFDIDTTNPDFASLHYLLNKAIFELNVYEKNIANQRQQNTVEEGLEVLESVSEH